MAAGKGEIQGSGSVDFPLAKVHQQVNYYVGRCTGLQM